MNLYELQNRISFDARKRFSRKFFGPFGVIVIILVTVIFLLIRLSLPPKNFPTNEIIEIPEGVSIGKAGKILEEKQVIKSRAYFQTFAILFAENNGVRAGFYSFDEPHSVIIIAKKVAHGTYGIARVKTTFPEGVNIREMSEIIVAEIPKFSKDEFLVLAKDKEGFLFPETYFFFQTVTAEEIIGRLEEEFNKKIAPYIEEIGKSAYSLSEIIIMASIIEKETNGKNDYETISGILWNRLKKNMRLEVDATSIYVTENNSVKAIDIKNEPSAYNTYTHDGLPPTPIGNPGLKAIEAALRPAKTEYLFYLHSDDGTIHYAKTYEGHRQNISKYLK